MLSRPRKRPRVGRFRRRQALATQRRARRLAMVRERCASNLHALISTLWRPDHGQRNLQPARDGTANRDPLTGAPGAHPVGTGAGAVAGGMAAGAAVGTVAGPVGTAVGAAVGAIVGGLAGKGIAEQIDPTVEDAYWRDNYRSGRTRAARATTTTVRPTRTA